MDTYQRTERDPLHSQQIGQDGAVQRLTEQDTGTFDRGDDRGRIGAWIDKLDTGFAGRLVPGTTAEALEVRHEPDRATTRVAIPTGIRRQHRGVAKAGPHWQTEQAAGVRPTKPVDDPVASSTGSLS
jgi:hypothetical protein